MIKSQDIINKICAKLSAGGLTELETCQTTAALNFLNNPVFSVSTFNNLPNAAEYAGRLIYVDDENRYYHAVEGYWLSKLNSEIFNYADEILSWGCNEFGVLGDNTIVNKSSPVTVVGGFTDWCQVSTGSFGCHALGVRQNGTAWAWGNNGSGRLGDGTITSRLSPVTVIGGITNWCQVSAGGSHSLGLTNNGTAYAWGLNFLGRLGDGTTADRSSPVSVVGGITNWSQVSAGGSHSLGLTNSGTAWTWGLNFDGQLGDGTSTTRSSPVSVVGGFTDWIQVSAGGSHSLGLTDDGIAYAWGCNILGQLGDGTTTNRSSPVSVVGGFTDWCQVSAGSIHSLGVRTNGTAWAWGCNILGQLGDGTTADRSSPVSVVGGITNWCQLSAGFLHSLGVRTNGTAWAWGSNSSGSLGNGTTTFRSSPVTVAGDITNWCQVSAGNNNSLGLRQACKGF